MGGNHTLKCAERTKGGEGGGAEDRAQGALGAESGAEGLQHPEGLGRVDRSQVWEV